MPKLDAISNRHAVFIALNKYKNGLTTDQIRSKIKMDKANGQLGVILRGEVEGGRMRVTEEYPSEGRTVLIYKLTALGRKHLEKDMIDSYAKENGFVALGRPNSK